MKVTERLPNTVYEKGERVTVRYRPADPTRARLDSFGENWGPPILMGSYGAALMAVGGLARRWGRDRQRAESLARR